MEMVDVVLELGRWMQSDMAHAFAQLFYENGQDASKSMYEDLVSR